MIVDLNGLDIGSSIKISFIKLPENVTPTIQGRDFVIATVAAPTIVKSPKSLLKQKEKLLKVNRRQPKEKKNKLKVLAIKQKAEKKIKKKINLLQRKNNN